MVQLTDHAANELKAIKAEAGMEPSEGIKLIPDGDSVDVAIAEPTNGDEVISRDGEPLLIVDAILTEPLRGLTFDCEDVEVDGEMEHRFMLRAA
jgi:hypothetical protein